MNVYVVSNGWAHAEGVVIGAAVDWDRAGAIANRAGDEGGGWSPWKEEVSAVEGSCVRERVALRADGTAHSARYQEIVVVPLDGVD